MFTSIFALITVAFLWGVTNPLIKSGAKGIKKVKVENVCKQFLLEIKFLFTNLQYVIPMILNQMGSIIYFFALHSVDLSLAVPVTNSLTFMFTAISGTILGEQSADKNTYIGMFLILMGTALCCYDKYLNIEDNLQTYF